MNEQANWKHCILAVFVTLVLLIGAAAMVTTGAFAAEHGSEESERLAADDEMPEEEIIDEENSEEYAEDEVEDTENVHEDSGESSEDLHDESAEEEITDSEEEMTADEHPEDGQEGDQESDQDEYSDEYQDEYQDEEGYQENDEHQQEDDMDADELEPESSYLPAKDMISSAELAEMMEAGRIKSVDGTVFILRNAESLTAEKGTPVMAADRIITGEDSGAAVFLRDDTSITLGPDSSLDLAMFEFNPAKDKFGLVARMKYGTFSWISGVMAKLAPKNIEIQTPSATIGIRGTKFLVHIPKEG